MQGRGGCFGCSFLLFLLACSGIAGGAALYLATPTDLITPISLVGAGLLLGFVGFVGFVMATFSPSAATGVTEILRMARRGVSANKVRAAFPVIGVTVSVAAVILLVAVGQGMKGGIAGQLGALGPDILRVEPATKSRIENPPDPDNPIAGISFITALSPANKAAALQRQSLKQSDITELLKDRGSDLIDKAAPQILNTEYLRNGDKKTQTTVIGTTADYQDVLDWKVDTSISGSRWINGEALDEVVIGQTVKAKLFPDDSAANVIGKNITLEDADLKQHTYKIVGIMEQKEKGIASATDNKMFFSLAAARALYTGNLPPPQNTKIDYGDRLDEIDIKVKDYTKANQLKDAKEWVSSTLTRLRANDPEETKYFLIRDAADISKPNEAVFQKMDIALGAIILIALVEAGMGVLMIMYVSVKERTREIGVRKAMGATNGQVVGQFLTESILLCVIGAIIGVPLGLLMTFATSFVMSATIQIWSIPLAIFSIFLVGVFAGLFPSQQAARIPPVEALRSE